MWNLIRFEYWPDFVACCTQPRDHCIVPHRWGRGRWGVHPHTSPRSRSRTRTPGKRGSSASSTASDPRPASRSHLQQKILKFEKKNTKEGSRDENTQDSRGRKAKNHITNLVQKDKGKNFIKMKSEFFFELGSFCSWCDERRWMKA